MRPDRFKRLLIASDASMAEVWSVTEERDVPQRILGDTFTVLDHSLFLQNFICSILQVHYVRICLLLKLYFIQKGGDRVS